MRALILLAALALAGTAHAQVYKCVDASGKTIYAQMPCPKGARSTTLNRNPPPPPAPVEGQSPGVNPKSAAQLEQEFRKRRLEKAEADKKAGEKEAQAQGKEENCRAARAQLAGLNSGMRQVRVNERGERVYLDDSQIEQEKARAQRAMDASCK